MNKILCVLMICLTCRDCVALVVHDPQTCAQAINQLHQTASHYSKEIGHWQDQISHFKQQSGLLKNQLSSITGLRDIGDLEGELKSLIQELKSIEKHRELLNGLLRSSNSTDNEHANAILDKYQMFNICKEKGNKKLDNICKEQILNKAGTIEAGEEIRKRTERKIIETSKIAVKIKNTKDIKESQDLANAIALKDIEIKQLKNQWDSFVDESELRERLIEEKRREAFHEHQRNAPLPNIEFKQIR